MGTCDADGGVEDVDFDELRLGGPAGTDGCEDESTVEAPAADVLGSMTAGGREDGSVDIAEVGLAKPCVEYNGTCAPSPGGGLLVESEITALIATTMQCKSACGICRDCATHD